MEGQLRRPGGMPTCKGEQKRSWDREESVQGGKRRTVGEYSLRSLRGKCFKNIICRIRVGRQDCKEPTLFCIWEFFYPFKQGTHSVLQVLEEGITVRK